MPDGPDTSSAALSIPVTPDNFARAETDLYFGGVVKNGGFGKFDHTRDPAPLDKQTVIRLNRDTLYSAAVFDLDAESDCADDDSALDWAAEQLDGRPVELWRGSRLVAKVPGADS